MHQAFAYTPQIPLMLGKRVCIPLTRLYNVWTLKHRNTLFLVKRCNFERSGTSLKELGLVPCIWPSYRLHRPMSRMVQGSVLHLPTLGVYSMNTEIHSVQLYTVTIERSGTSFIELGLVPCIWPLYRPHRPLALMV